MLWTHRGVCCECEETLRRRGECPFNGGRCRSLWWCPHTRLCASCDTAFSSCHICRLHRGDAATVAHLTKYLRPSRIALDFDRTLATTRSGACPVVGQHSVDQELMELFFPASFSRESSPGHNRAIAAPACCGVVTRNRHTGRNLVVPSRLLRVISLYAFVGIATKQWSI